MSAPEPSGSGAAAATAPPVKKAQAEYKVSPLLKDVPASGDFWTVFWIYALLPLAWVSVLMTTLRNVLDRPLRYFYRKDRNALQLQLPPDLDGIQSRMLDIGGGITLHAATYGPAPEKPLMLFLHGYPELWYSWRHQLPAFREGYEVVAVDMRGYNMSAKPQGLSSYTIDQLAADVPRIVAALGRTSCTLVSHDWGGIVAWAAAGIYPGLVDRLVVLAAPHWLMFTHNANLQQLQMSLYVLMFQMPWVPERYFLHNDSVMLQQLFQGRPPMAPTTKGAVSDADMEFYKQSMQRPGAATATLNYYRAFVLQKLGWLPVSKEVERGLQRQLDLPVLVLWGSQDHALLPRLLTGIDEVAPDNEVHLLQGCSHWVQQDKPAQVNEIMKEWLGRH